MSRRAARALAVGLLALVLPLSGCISMPESGPVVETGSEGILEDPPAPYIDPKPPEPDAPPADIVAGFLDAMTATPMQLNDARQFLTDDADAAWSPGDRTITYAEMFQPRGTTEVSVRLVGARYLDARGSYRGALPRKERIVDFPMERVDGQWRVSRAPDALVVPESWFEARFRRASLYFFDPSAQVLVPEPVFLPAGEQFPTALVRALLRGPAGGLSGTTRTFLPPGLRIGSVPISQDGVAELAFTGFSGRLNPKASQLMLAQLAWLLRQDPAIESFRVLLGDQPVSLPGGVAEFSVDEGLEYDPTGIRASSSLFGLREGRLVAGVPGELLPVDGPMGARELGIRSFAVNLDATTVAGVTGEGARVLVTSVRGGTGEPVTEVVSEADDLLRPAWDFSDRLWMVDRRAGRARVFYWTPAGRGSVRVPGVTGEDVSRFLVSRDGSRLVAVVRRDRGDRVVVSRIQRDARGQVVGASRARVVSWEGGRDLRIRGLAWTSPTSVAVLHRVARQLFEVRTVPVDGSPAGVEDLLTTLPTRVLGLAGSPVASERLFAVTRTSLVDPRGEVAQAGLGGDTVGVGYVG